MKTRPLITDHSQRDQHQYALCRRLGFWEVTFEGRHATFQHEPGAPYIARLLLHPPPKPIHALALALDARTLFRPAPTAAEVIQQRLLGLEEAGTVRSLRRRERELEAVLDDPAVDSVIAIFVRPLATQAAEVVAAIRAVGNSPGARRTPF